MDKRIKCKLTSIHLNHQDIKYILNRVEITISICRQLFFLSHLLICLGMPDYVFGIASILNANKLQLIQITIVNPICIWGKINT